MEKAYKQENLSFSRFGTVAEFSRTGINPAISISGSRYWNRLLRTVTVSMNYLLEQEHETDLWSSPPPQHWSLQKSVPVLLYGTGIKHHQPSHCCCIAGYHCSLSRLRSGRLEIIVFVRYFCCCLVTVLVNLGALDTVLLYLLQYKSPYL